MQPAVGRTDGDGLSDPLEHQNLTNCTRVDTDDDGLSDHAEIDLCTSPTEADTDGDGLLDGPEHLELLDGGESGASSAPTPVPRIPTETR